MVSALKSLPLLRQHVGAEDDLVAIVANARSYVEANLALGMLRERLPERVIVAALNLREVLDSLPKFPCAMGVDETTLAKIAKLKKRRSVWRRTLTDDRRVAVSVTTAGNLCFDLIVEVNGVSLLWAPPSAEEDIINPAALDAVLEHEAILPAVIGLTNDMGLVFNPRFYMSLDDWNLDNLQESFGDFSSLF